MWKRLKISGRGGTDMTQPFKWLEDNHLIADCTILLTDGETPWPEKKAYPTIFVITSENGHHAKGPEWGKIINIEI